MGCSCEWKSVVGFLFHLIGDGFAVLLICIAFGTDKNIFFDPVFLQTRSKIIVFNAGVFSQNSITWTSISHRLSSIILGYSLYATLKAEVKDTRPRDRVLQEYPGVGRGYNIRTQQLFRVYNSRTSNAYSKRILLINILLYPFIKYFLIRISETIF